MMDELLKLSEVAAKLRISPMTLRRWDKDGKLKSVRIGQRGHRYYRKAEIELLLHSQDITDLFGLAKSWLIRYPSVPDSQFYCETRDVFQVRLERFQNEMSKISGLESIFSLIAAIAGEIGNNSFDHNLGNWPDVAGVFFGYDLERRYVVLADRGLGILTTLKRVRSNLKSHSQALELAFTEIISGRAPEARGNGLKFVRNIVAEYPLKFYFQSGDAFIELKQYAQALSIQKSDFLFHGCLANLSF